MKIIATAALRPAREFLHWWFFELAESTRDLRARIAPHWRGTLTAYVSETRLQIVDSGSQDEPPLLDISHIGSGTEPTYSISESERGMLSGNRRVRLVFSPQFAFQRTIRMPLAALPHLATAIDLQLSKLVPMQPALLHIDYEIVGVNPDGATADIELAAIKRSDIEPISKTLKQWGLQPGAAHLGSSADSGLRFKFGDARSQINRFAITRTDFFLAASAAVLAICAIAVLTVQTIRARGALDRALAQTGEQAASVLQQREQLITRLDMLAVISEGERAPTAAAIVADITSRMSRDAWLTTLEIKGRDVRLVGLSSDPSTIVKQLAGSSLLTDVELHSSMAAPGSSGRERFEIAAQVKATT